MLNKKGLSSSEASRIANFLKEQVKGIELTPDTFQIITSTTVRDGKEFQLDTNQPIDKWMDKIYEKSRFYSLSAWLMEAIKLKESLIQKERNNSFDESTISSTLVTYDAPRPIKANTTLEEYLRTLTIKLYAEYLREDAFATHIGKFIHNFDAVREKIKNFVPTSFVEISPTETLTVQNKLIYDTNTLYKNVEELQARHREAEKLTNYYKAKHKEWAADKDREYQIDLDKWNSESHKISQENYRKIQSARAKFEVAKTTELERLAGLKIEIPNDLQDIVNEVLEKLEVK